nr:zinc finger BED domain-containing protein RICESLEEPER 2-like [Tanacetum cinerariifolium]
MWAISIFRWRWGFVYQSYGGGYQRDEKKPGDLVKLRVVCDVERSEKSEISTSIHMYQDPGSSSHGQGGAERIRLYHALRNASLKRSRGNTSSSELERYQGSDFVSQLTVEEFENFDILGWWKEWESQFPVLAAMARDLLTVQASTVALESAFSVSGRVISPRRIKLTPSAVEACICLKDHLDSMERIQNISPLEGDLERVEEEIHSEEIAMSLAEMESKVPMERQVLPATMVFSLPFRSYHIMGSWVGIRVMYVDERKCLTDPINVWEQTWQHLAEDVELRQRRIYKNPMRNVYFNMAHNNFHALPLANLNEDLKKMKRKEILRTWKWNEVIDVDAIPDKVEIKTEETTPQVVLSDEDSTDQEEDLHEASGDIEKELYEESSDLEEFYDEDSSDLEEYLVMFDETNQEEDLGEDDTDQDDSDDGVFSYFMQCLCFAIDNHEASFVFLFVFANDNHEPSGVCK